MSIAMEAFSDRRLRSRHDALGLNAHITKLGLFGKTKSSHPVDILNLSLSGVAISTPLKLKLNRPLLLDLEYIDHRLTAIPVVVTRKDDDQSTPDNNVYGLKYTLGTLPENARSLAYSLLKLIEERLISSANAA